MSDHSQEFHKGEPLIFGDNFLDLVNEVGLHGARDFSNLTLAETGDVYISCFVNSRSISQEAVEKHKVIFLGSFDDETVIIAVPTGERSKMAEKRVKEELVAV